MGKFVSRAGEKLEFALAEFKLNVKGLVCADLGSSTGGFVDCLLQNGAKKVYAVEVGYGTIDWNLRNDKRVVVMERTNAIHIELPEKVDLITIDVGWTKQEKILPNAFRNLSEAGVVISLIKPHYEADQKYLRKGKLLDERVNEVLTQVKKDIKYAGGQVIKTAESPILGEKGKNREFLVLIKPS
jgi:23S rRNA (cytidine1920-2'-O)/16S rRNA (cytidine1409-2'-O)-methyltransferase